MTMADYRHVLAAGLSMLLASYTAVLLVDILRLFRPEFLDGLLVPFLWDYLFREASLIEFFQWLFLAGFSLTAAYTAGVREGEEKKFWGLLAVSGSLMLIEDAGNIRHFIIRDLLSLSWNMLNVLETAIFGVIALPLITALLLYRERPFQQETVRKLLVLGVIFYGFAAFLSGPADLTGLNDSLGDSIKSVTDWMSGGQLSEVYSEVDEDIKDRRPTGYMDVSARFVDFLVEESLELLGATFLFASAASARRTSTV